MLQWLVNEWVLPNVIHRSSRHQWWRNQFDVYRLSSTCCRTRSRHALFAFRCCVEVVYKLPFTMVCVFWTVRYQLIAWVGISDTCKFVQPLKFQNMVYILSQESTFLLSWPNTFLTSELSFWASMAREVLWLSWLTALLKNVLKILHVWILYTKLSMFNYETRATSSWKQYFVTSVFVGSSAMRCF